MSAFQFIVASIGSAVVISAVSLLWPKFTNRPAPLPLKQVRRVVEQTAVGRQATQVLGVGDEGQTQPIDLQQWAAQQGNAILGNITDSASKVVISSVVRQVIGQIDTLPNDQKDQLREILCASSSGITP